MSKQDRQGVRTAADLERKYDFGEIFGNKGSFAKLAEQLNRLTQTTAQFMAATDAEFLKLQKNIDANTKKIAEIYPVGSFFTSVNNTNPSTMFGGIWELYTEGYIVIGQEVGEDDPPALLQSLSKCYVWHRTA